MRGLGLGARRGSAPISRPAKSISMLYLVSPTAHSMDWGWSGPARLRSRLRSARARIAGFEARNAAARFKLDANGIQIERLSVADFGNAAFEAKGRIETSTTPGGSIAVDLDARELNAVIALADKFTPMLAESLRRMARGDGTAKLRAMVSLEHAAGGSAAAKFAVNGRVGAVRLDVAANATGKPENFVVTDLGALADADARFEGKFEADDGAKVLALIGLDQLAALEQATKGPARLTISTTGPLNREVRIDGQLGGRRDRCARQRHAALPADLAATVNLDQVSGTIANRKLQGRLTLRYGDEPRIDGAIETDSPDVVAVVGAAIGMRAPNATEPLRSAVRMLRAASNSRCERAALSSSLSGETNARRRPVWAGRDCFRKPYSRTGKRPSRRTAGVRHRTRWRFGSSQCLAERCRCGSHSRRATRSAPR